LEKLKDALRPAFRQCDAGCRATLAAKSQPHILLPFQVHQCLCPEQSKNVRPLHKSFKLAGSSSITANALNIYHNASIQT